MEKSEGGKIMALKIVEDVVGKKELEGLTIKPKTFERIVRMKETNLKEKPGFTAERAVIFTRVYKETEGEPEAIRRAKAFAATLREMEIDIGPYELLVGREAVRPRCGQSYPELWAEDFYHELEEVKDRSRSPLEVSEEDVKQLLEYVRPYWRGKSLGTKLFSIMPQDHKDYWYLDPTAEVPMETGFPGTMQGLYNNTLDETYVNHYNVLEYGYDGLRQNAEDELAKLDIYEGLDAVKKAQFCEAVAISYKAVSDFIMRYADLAKEKAAAEADETRKQELEQIAETCEWIAFHPARTFREAIQVVQFNHTVIKIEVLANDWTTARFDQYLYPFYKRDIENGTITDDEVLELIQCFWLKCADYTMPRSESGAEFEGGYSVWFNVNIGGTKSDGSDATNELSHLCLDASAGVQLYQPDIAVRVHKNTPEDLLKHAVEVAAICPTIKFYNDEMIIPAIMTLSEGKMPIEDARNYTNLACVEAAVVEKCSFANCVPFGNLGAAVEMALNNGVSRLYNRRFGPETGDPREFKSMEEVMEAFRLQFRHITKMVCGANNLGDETRIRNMYLPFMSGSRPDLVEKGVCMCGDMDKCADSPYNYNFFVVTGFGDVAESFNVINQLVFEKKKITMAELVDALDHNFEGPYERIQNMIKYDVVHYGNDEEEADKWAEIASHIISEETYEYYKTCTGHLCHVNIQSATMNVGYGVYTGALPTGRKAGEPLADASGPISGFDTNGPTACVKSVGRCCCKASHDIGKPNLNLFNLRLNSELIHSESGLNNWVALIKLLFEEGGTHVQFNLTDSEELRDAQVKPEDHRDLLVRVAGYAAYFTELGRDVQDDIIDRTVHGAW